MVNIEGFSADRFADASSSEYPGLCAAETAECGCPDRCERDHGNE
jgi:hypothetical protein